MWDRYNPIFWQNEKANQDKLIQCVDNTSTINRQKQHLIETFTKNKHLLCLNTIKIYQCILNYHLFYIVNNYMHDCEGNMIYSPRKIIFPTGNMVIYGGINLHFPHNHALYFTYDSEICIFCLFCKERFYTFVFWINHNKFLNSSYLHRSLNTLILFLFKNE